MRLSANKIKQLRSLSQKKFRNEQKLFIVEGEKLVEEALHSDFNVVEVFRQEEIGIESMEKISQLATPSPILAVVEQKEASLKELELKKDSVFFLLDSIKDPGNLGTIIRTAEWFGISAVIASPGCVELYNPKTVQATMGAIFRMKVIFSPLAEAIALLRKSNAEVFATVLDGKSIKNISSIVKGKCSAFIFGNEANGISKEIQALVDKDHRVLVPQFNKQGKAVSAKEFCGSESLNVASTVAAISALIREL